MTKREPGMKEEDSVAANARIAMIRGNGNLKVSATEPWEKAILSWRIRMTQGNERRRLRSGEL